MEWEENLAEALLTKKPLCPHCGKVLEYLERKLLLSSAVAIEKISWDGYRFQEYNERPEVVHVKYSEEKKIRCPHCEEQLCWKFLEKYGPFLEVIN